MGLIGFILLITVVMLFDARDRIKRLEHRVRDAESAIYGLQPSSPTLSDSLEIVSTPDDPAPKKPLPTEAQQEAKATSDPEFAAATEVIPLKPTMADEQKTDAARELVKGYRMPARVISRQAEPIAELAKSTADIMDANIGEASAPIGNNSNSTEASPPSEIPDAERRAQDHEPERIKARGLSFNFEDLFGHRLPIWAGGITLAIAGILIVKYAIDVGFIQRVFTPRIQVLSGFLFGTGLVAGAELAYRKAAQVDDPRISQALSGAGVATLYSTIMIAANGYGLIGPMAAFLGLAAITAGALGLSIRFGAPSALLGLAGGLAAPAMVGGVSDNVPMLAVYLALTIAGLSGVSRMQRWPWLGLAALVGGAGWSLWMILANTALGTLASLSIGGLVLLFAIAIPLLTLSGARAALMRTVAALVGAAQLAILVAMGGFQPLHWGLFALLAAAGQWLSYRDRHFDIVPTISLGLSIFLLAIWPEPAAGWFIGIGLTLMAILGLPLLMKIWQKHARLQLALELCGLSVAAPLLAFWQFYIHDHSRDAIFSVVAAGVALLPAAAIFTGWKRDDRYDDTRFSWLTITTGALLMISISFALPVWQVPLGFAAIAAATLFLGEKSGDPRIEGNASEMAAVACLALIVTMKGDWQELTRLITGQVDAVDIYAVLRWSGLAALFALFAFRAKNPLISISAHASVGAFAYGTAAQILPGWMLPISLGLIALVMLFVALRHSDRQLESQAVTFGLLAIPLLVITQSYDGAEWLRLVGLSNSRLDVFAGLRWGALSAVAILYASRSRMASVRNCAPALAAALFYGAVSQVIPATFVPLIAPFALVSLAHWGKGRAWSSSATASGMFVFFLIGWAAYPVIIWGTKAALSLIGTPMVIDGNLLSIMMITARLLCPAALLGLALWISRERLPQAVKKAGLSLAVILTFIAVHSLYRLGFASMFGADFVMYGLPQRLVWSAILMGAGWTLWLKAQGATRAQVAPAIIASSALHLTWYSLLLHNPVWSAQAVGAWPAFNLLVPLFCLTVTALHLLPKMAPEKHANAAMRTAQLLHMMLICWFTWASLRQAFHGSMLTASGVSPAEDILRSILAIALAIGFLLWGIRIQQRDWRIVSLVLLLAATTKVFLFDTSGLEGLMRIGSFVALGFSLIGIGWLYSKQLRRDTNAQD